MHSSNLQRKVASLVQSSNYIIMRYFILNINETNSQTREHDKKGVPNKKRKKGLAFVTEKTP